jgi:hypothetical protein
LSLNPRRSIDAGIGHYCRVAEMVPGYFLAAVAHGGSSD